jgi:hypothetical protein
VGRSSFPESSRQVVRVPSAVPELVPQTVARCMSSAIKTRVAANSFPEGIQHRALSRKPASERDVRKVMNAADDHLPQRA